MTTPSNSPDITGVTPDNVTEQPPETNPHRRPLLNGRGSLFVAAALGMFTIYIVYGIMTMEVPDSAQSPGPKLYPTLLAIASGVLTVVLIIDTLRNPDSEPAHRYTAPVGETVKEALIPVQETDNKNLALGMLTFLIFAFILEPVGWIISAALLFWAIALCMGAKRPLFNLGVGLVVSSTIQVAFSMGLGLSLPAGILGGIF